MGKVPHRSDGRALQTEFRKARQEMITGRDVLIIDQEFGQLKLHLSRSLRLFNDSLKLAYKKPPSINILGILRTIDDYRNELVERLSKVRLSEGVQNGS